MAVDSAGDFVVAWTDSSGADGSSYGVFAQRYNASGTPAGSEFQVNTYTAGNQTLPSAAMDSAGDLVVVWESNGTAPNFPMESEDGYQSGVYAKQYPVYNPPVITTTASALNYTAGSGPVDVDPGVTITDTENGGNVTSATITIASGYFPGQDVLGFTNQNNITGSFNSVSGR